jgi:hypothetical protein
VTVSAGTVTVCPFDPVTVTVGPSIGTDGTVTAVWTGIV